MAAAEPEVRGLLERELRTLSDSGERGAVIDGLAVGARSIERLTRDVDLTTTIDNETLERVFETANRHGLVPRIEDHLAFARQYRMVLLVDTVTGIDVDLAMASLPFEIEAIDHADPIVIAGLAVPVVSAEDLMVMKVVAGRPQDLVDARGLLSTNPGIAVERVRRILLEFDEALDHPGLVAEFDRMRADVGGGQGSA